jgi:NAD(P)H-dependent FMN reductase
LKLKTRLAVIYGSNREQRLCDTVGRWALSRLEAHGGYEVDLIDPATMHLPPRLASEPDDTILGFRRRIAEADAFLIVTPEYNHGYTAVLKFLIDSALEEWHDKPAAFVSYGGQSGGLRAVEQLRQVLAELRVVTMRESVSLVNAWDQFDEGGRFRDPAAANRALAGMLGQLERWSKALGEFRATRAEAVAA